MAARLTRAKKKIAAARIPYAVPAAAELPARVDAVLTVIHLLYTTGHTAPSGDDLVRDDLAERALDLARMLRALLPGDREAPGCWRCCSSTTRAGPPARTTRAACVRLEDQDRAPWDRAADRRGRPAGRRPRSPAARPAASRCRRRSPRCTPRRRATPRPTGRRSSTLYDALLRVWPSPVVALNRAVAAWRWSRGPTAALAEVEALERDGRLAGYRYLPATKADLLRRLGRHAEAADAYRAALALADNAAERAFLERRLGECATPPERDPGG